MRPSSAPRRHARSNAWTAARIALLLTVPACTDRGPTQPRVSFPEASASNSQTPGGAFVWLAPIGSGSPDPIALDPNARPQVTICVWVNAACVGSPIATFSTSPSGTAGAITVNSATGQYEVDWNLLNTSFTSRKTYKIRVLGSNLAEIGATLVDVVRGRWAPTSATGALNPLVAANVLQLRFLIAKAPVVSLPSSNEVTTTIRFALPPGSQVRGQDLHVVAGIHAASTSAGVGAANLGTTIVQLVAAATSDSKPILFAVVVGAPAGELVLDATSTAEALAMLAPGFATAVPTEAADKLAQIRASAQLAPLTALVADRIAQVGINWLDRPDPAITTALTALLTDAQSRIPSALALTRVPSARGKPNHINLAHRDSPSIVGATSQSGVTLSATTNPNGSTQINIANAYGRWIDIAAYTSTGGQTLGPIDPSGLGTRLPPFVPSKKLSDFLPGGSSPSTNLVLASGFTKATIKVFGPSLLSHTTALQDPDVGYITFPTTATIFVDVFIPIVDVILGVPDVVAPSPSQIAELAAGTAECVAGSGDAALVILQQNTFSDLLGTVFECSVEEAIEEPAVLATLLFGVGASPTLVSAVESFGWIRLLFMAWSAADLGYTAGSIEVADELTVFEIDDPMTVSAAPTSLMFARQGSAVPPDQTISITNSGGGVINDLAVGPVVYGGSASGWLNTTLSSTVAPASLRLSVIASLPPGTYQATVPINSPSANSSATVLATLTVQPAGSDNRIALVEVVPAPGGSQFRVVSLDPNGGNRQIIYATSLASSGGCVGAGNLAWSPDRTSILVPWSACGFARNIDKLNVTTGTLVPFISALDKTRTLVGADDPAWSADGNSIAFARGGSGAVASTPQISTVSTAAVANLPPSTICLCAAETVLTAGPPANAFPSWSPDGQQIAFSCGIWPGTLCVIPSSGGQPTAIATPGIQAVFQSQLSADGSMIAFVGMDAGGTDGDLFAVHSDGTNLIRLTNNRYPSNVLGGLRLAWSPTGNQLLLSTSGQLLRFDVPSSAGSPVPAPVLVGTPPSGTSWTAVSWR